MADLDIDSLRIEITSSSAQANKSINKLAKSLENLKQSLTGLEPGISALNDLHSSMTNIGNFNAKGFRDVANQIKKISSGGTGASNSMKKLNTVMRSGSPIMNALASGSKDLVSSLKKIGGGALTGLKDVVAQISGLKRSSSGVSNLTSNLKTLLATVIGFRGITGVFNWLKESVSMGADLTEIDHIVESVFGEDMVGYVQDWADNALESFGIASTAAKKYAGTLSAMFQASNVGMEDSNKMAMDLVELAGDLSAFYNIDTETAYNKLKSGMAGMVRPLRDLGIDLSVAALKEYALSQGIEKSYTSMTQGEKMMLRYKYLLEQTSMQSGDFARTSGKLKTAA